MHDGLLMGRARTVSSRMVGIDRPEHRRLICAQPPRWDEGPPLGVLFWSDRRLKSDDFEALDVPHGLSSAGLSAVNKGSNAAESCRQRLDGRHGS